MSRRLIVTADDFGMSMEVNEAVEAAHREGILTCASLVVAGEAAADAIRRAKRMPTLGVGLHLSLYGAPTASPGKTCSRIAPDGANLGGSPVSTGIAIMLSSAVRAEARRELTAQFEAWRRSGLPLGHLDGHWHCHQHPAILGMALELGKPLGLRAMRIPYEAFGLSRRVASGRRSLSRRIEACSHYPLAIAMRHRAGAAGLRVNDWFFGKNDAGSMTAELLERLVTLLRPGTTEVGLHPAVKPWRGPHSPPASWQADRELDALTDPVLRRVIASHRVELCRWADLP